MSEIKASQVKELRERTGAGMMDCKNALVECAGDMAQAVEALQKRAAAKAVKRMDREASEGIVQSYIHGKGRIGVLLELNSETDFVARNDDFSELARELCLHVAASGPLFVSRETLPEGALEQQEALFKAQVIESGKPEAIADKIVTGKINKWLGEVCMDEQPWFRDGDVAVKEVLQQYMGKLGENIKIRRFVRWELGEGLD
ncbi:MAG: translation elongation factor Ts [Myxococcales bacterium]|nr:translation elongation factor Ts [Myxococcales bacterium]|tara:strand:- start:2887 stop:3492 length:606 start_codon:yes stop_codon:yes gene_type:complete